VNNKLYVGNLVFSATEQDLIDLFSQHGSVAEAKIITEPSTQRSRGFAFVTMQSPEDAQKAAEALNGVDFQGRALTVNEARPQGDRNFGDRPRRSGGGGGGGGERHGGGGGGRGGDRGGDRGGRPQRRGNRF